MSNAKQPVSDNQLYESIHFRVETLRFYIDSLIYYKDLLDKELAALQEEDFIRRLFDEGALEESLLAQERVRVESLIKRIQRVIDNPQRELGPSTKRDIDFPFREISLRHKTVRYIKSVVNLYVAYLQASRDRFIRSHGVSKAVLQAIDSRMAKVAESNTGGVFEEAGPIALLVDFSRETTQEETLTEESPHIVSKRASSPALPTPIYGIEMLDSELRERCCDLLEHCLETQDAQKLDTVVSEATRVLENRIRSLPGVDSNERDPVGAAFGGNSPVVRVSDNTTERKGAYFLFRGVFQFVRNPFHHKIVPINRERVIQLLGLIDYLLYVIDSAEKAEPSP